MKYESDIAKTIHESATERFAIGAITEARMREYDEMCLVPETQHEYNTHETVNIEHPDLVTA